VNNYYRIGFDIIPDSVKKRIRDEAEKGARAGVAKEIPRIRREVRDEATKAVGPVARREAAAGAKQAVLPMIIGSVVLSGAAILIALGKK
jgi:hypothetical protein